MLEITKIVRLRLEYILINQNSLIEAQQLTSVAEASGTGTAPMTYKGGIKYGCNRILCMSIVTASVALRH